jgi:RNA polymerase sigma-70 factor (ECF subfamily)
MYDFDELWNKFNLKLLNYIKTTVANTHDAEDILQNVFVKIFNSIEQLENQSAVKPWIYKITKNTIIDFYKKKKDMLVPHETLYMIEDEIDDIDNMNDDISNCMKNMVFNLPDKYQNVYDLYENKAMKHKEIAKVLDISVPASKVRLKRAKDMIREKLLECCDFEVDKYGNIINYHPKIKYDGCSGKC